ncbi:hypothetical protein [Corynebacterium pygosceleis]|uniref:Lipoprotein LpqE n=1 Tax=Corynebacterium pygosceleis TaxID=2800406 RepID=A0A9Q4CA44_9CORY|nr:hypothetical protein [Corynebacterium pygosceleis]MCK7638432.1 hypothetical protein [Corynebacterium pygosceleis]MCK7675412.1 hypothetical protein [Corynebacterium pygosceleis]MCL0121194.1 hypothetical protein [Corynebacterium pygosceleis]MCX7445408.1 hypothetical protein [Corynebacterium pygosceleis]MCX7469096.1 hypothetical protein [Corynebacterium pygosceleis]
MTTKTVKGAAAALVSVAAALTLSACSSGQISQTASQVAAVDGARAETPDGKVAVRDVTVEVNGTSTASLRFTLVNQDTDMTVHALKSATVDGEKVTLRGETELGRDCSIVAGSREHLDSLPEVGDGICISHLVTGVRDKGFPPGGNADIVFTFDNGETIDVSATIAAPTLAPADIDRTEQGGDGHGESSGH